MARVALTEITVLTYFSRWHRASRKRAKLMDADTDQMTELVEAQAALLSEYVVTPLGETKVVDVDNAALKTVLADAPDDKRQDLMVALRSMFLEAVEEDEILGALPSALES